MVYRLLFFYSSLPLDELSGSTKRVPHVYPIMRASDDVLLPDRIGGQSVAGNAEEHIGRALIYPTCPGYLAYSLLRMAKRVLYIGRVSALHVFGRAVGQFVVRLDSRT
jgi:hypothetical protein